MNQSEQDKIILKNIAQCNNNKRGAKQAKMNITDYIKRKRYLVSLKEQPASGITETNYNLEKGTATLKGIFTKEPMSPDEVRSWFKIDKSMWTLSNYWNKQQPNGTYLVSALISSIKSSQSPLVHIEDILQNVKLSYKPTTVKRLNEAFDDKVCAVFSMQDIHVGKLNIDKTDTIEQDVKDCVTNLIRRAYQSHYIDKIIWVLGGDLINMDTYGGTTTAGTPVENSISAYDAYKLAFNIQFWCINFLKEYCNDLHVVYTPGNHSRLSEAHIAYALSKIIIDDHITWDIDYKERCAIKYGINMLCFEHGDFNTNRSFFTFATEYAEIWGSTLNRVAYTGHFHKKKKTEYITEDEVSGFQLKILPSLSKSDMYHYSNKWTGNGRGAVLELHSEKEGFMAQFNKTLYI